MESGELFHNAHSGKLQNLLSLQPKLAGKLVAVPTRPEIAINFGCSPVGEVIYTKMLDIQCVLVANYSMARELIWWENNQFAAWGCGACNWVLVSPGQRVSNPST
jgi:hypothetical protein